MVFSVFLTSSVERPCDRLIHLHLQARQKNLGKGRLDGIGLWCDRKDVTYDIHVYSFNTPYLLNVPLSFLFGWHEKHVFTNPVIKIQLYDENKPVACPQSLIEPISANKGE
jgi:hypothetical protein